MNRLDAINHVPVGQAQPREGSFHQLIGDGEEEQGLGRLLGALYLKRSMLLTLTLCTTLLVLLQLLAIMFSSVFLRPSEAASRTSPVIHLKERDGARVVTIAPANWSKMCFIMVRETLYVVLLLPILFVMRLREKLPDFFGWELSSDPWTEGLFVDDFQGEDNPFPDMPNRLQADGRENRLAAMEKVRIKRKHFMGSCSEVESNMSDAFAQEKQAIDRDLDAAAHHKFIVVNPADYSVDIMESLNRSA